jgi:hypothetical protein
MKELHMIRWVTSVLVIAFLLAVMPRYADAGQPVSVAPSGGSAVKVKVGGKEQTYYSLTSSGRLQLKLDGPGKLTIMSRMILPGGGAGEVEYALALREKGSVAGRQTTRSERSDATLSSGGVLGKLRKMSVRVPAGTHTYELALENAGSTSAVVKFLFGAGKGPASMASIQAHSYSRVTTAVVKEKLLTYYVSAKDRDVQLRVIGPTRLKVTTRLNYDASMKGGQKYGVGVWEGDKRIVLKSLKTSKALAVSYQDWKDVVPGKVATFIVPVPSGEHRYGFRLEEGMGRTVSLRFAIPKKDLKNEN